MTLCKFYNLFVVVVCTICTVILFSKQVETLDNKEAKETEPYKWKYEARDLLTAKKDAYSKKLNNNNAMKNLSENDKSVLNDEFNVIKFHLAMNFITTEERNQGAPLFKDVVSYFRATKERRIKVK